MHRGPRNEDYFYLCTAAARSTILAHSTDMNPPCSFVATQTFFPLRDRPDELAA